MNKLIKLCLFILSSLMANAQTEKLNKEQTVAYINKIYISDGGNIINGYSMTLSWYKIGNSLSVDNLNCNSDNFEPIAIGAVATYANPIVRVVNYTSERHKDRQVYKIECDGNLLFDEIYNSNSANLIKEALEHLFKLFNDEGK